MFADEYLVLDTLKSKSRNLIKLDLQNVRNKSNEVVMYRNATQYCSVVVGLDFINLVLVKYISMPLHR